MLHHTTLAKLHTLRLAGMARALEEQLTQPDIDALGFEERLGLLVDREMTHRDDRMLQSRLSRARLRQNACIEDIDYRSPRGLDRGTVARLATCEWLRAHQNLLITGPAGVGKSWLACALSQQACRHGYSARYLRLPRLLEDLAVARADGSYSKHLASLARVNLLIIDDWALAPLGTEGRRDLLEIFDDRHQRQSTLLTSQLPVAQWHDYIGDPTLADAILDRLVHNAHRITLKGESLRKKQAPDLTGKDTKQP
jgi:DNA replication protein DnaC